MDSDQYVYISTVANFNMIKKLTSDLDLITDVLRSMFHNFSIVYQLRNSFQYFFIYLCNIFLQFCLDSKQVQVHSDGKRVRPVSNRTVVILRGITESTPIEEIKVNTNSVYRTKYYNLFSFMHFFTYTFVSICRLCSRQKTPHGAISVNLLSMTPGTWALTRTKMPFGLIAISERKFGNLK